MVVSIPFTWAEIDDLVLENHRILESLPRSDPHRPTLLDQLVGLRTQRFVFSSERNDLDKVVTHLTEAVFLSPSQKIAFALFHLVAALLSRFSFYRQPDDIK
jgi:hypothetical protein